MSLNTRFAETAQSTGLLLWQVTNRWQAAQTVTLKPFGLTHVQFVLLASLSWLEASGPVTQQRLASQASTDSMMTSQVVGALESRKLLSRQPHPTDGRARTLHLEAAGASLANKAIVAVESCDEKFFGDLGQRGEEFTSLLQALT